MDAAGGPSAAERIAELGYEVAARAKERPEECNLCGGRGRSVEICHRDRYGYPTTFVVCRSCGLGYISPRLDATGYADFYASMYRPLVSAYHGRRIDAETVQIDQRAYAAELVAYLAPVLPSPPATILDVGGSTGVVAGALAAGLGGRATVLDPAPDELAVARAAGMEVIAGFAEDFAPGERRWDLVLMCQTIDHLLDVRRTMAALRTLTATGGRAFVDILDVELVLEQTGIIHQAVKIDHPYYLTAATAKAYFAVAGYSVVGERSTPDGHRGFVLAPSTPAEPDWSALEDRAKAFLVNVGSRASPGDE